MGFCDTPLCIYYIGVTWFVSTGSAPGERVWYTPVSCRPAPQQVQECLAALSCLVLLLTGAYSSRKVDSCKVAVMAGFYDFRST